MLSFEKHFFLFLLLVCFWSRCFSQDQEKRTWYKFLKLNLVYKQPDSETFSLTNFQPAFVISSQRSFHEMGLTNFYFGKANSFEQYKPVKAFRTGVQYLYKRSLLRKPSKWTPQLGLSFSFNYESAHFIPKDPDIHKEVYQDVFTYAAYGNASLSYQLNKRIFIDGDLPILIWNAQYFEQKDILPTTRQVSYLVEWDHPREYFNFRLGFRYMIDASI